MKICYSLRLYSTFGLLALAVSCGQGNVNENFSANTQDAEQQISNKTTFNADSAMNADDDEVMGLVGQAKFAAVANRVTAFYKSILKREPDRGGLLNYVGLVLSNRLSLAQVRTALTKSPEAIVVRLYQSILGRLVDAGGRSHYTREITAGRLNEASLRAILLKSDESRAKIRSVIAAYYRAILQREPDKAGLANYVELLVTQRLSIGQVRAALTKSPEAIVVRLYQSILGRKVDAGGRAHYTREITAGRLNEASLRAILLNSSEYRAKIKSIAKQGVKPAY